MAFIDEVRQEVEKSHSLFEIKGNLLKRGYLEKDIDAALEKMLKLRSEEKNKNNRILSIKELFDRVGYGFASQQFINILFIFSGASVFLLGFLNGLKTIILYLFSGFLKEYSKIKYLGKSMMSISALVYGFSFLGMAVAVIIKNPWIFAASVILGTIGILSHGNLYMDFFNIVLKNERRIHFLRFISYFGILITAVSLLVSGLIMEKITSNTFNVFSLQLPGYLLTFEVTAIMFILSGYLLSFIDEKTEKLNAAHFSLLHSFSSYVRQATNETKIFAKNKKIFLLTIATMLTTITQILGNSYYGWFIYENFKSQFLGGFMNVAIIFVIALIASLSGTFLTKRFAKSLGEAPMLVFGTLLIAALPVTFYFNPNLYSLGLATAISVIGGAVVGVAQGLLAERLMNEQEIKSYFSSLGFVSIIPTILLVGAGALVAQLIGLPMLFLGLAIALGAIVMPLYFIIVLIADAEYRTQRAKLMMK
jgi:hypothetical protein